MPATKKPTKATKSTTTTKKPRKAKSAANPGDEAFARIQDLVQGTPVQLEVASAENQTAAKKAATKAATAQAAEEAKPKKLSALDAAAKVLGESGEPMTTKAMIDAMATKGYWTSPGGKTPHATLYSAILREIGTKKGESRFRKTDRGHFAAATA